MDNKKLLPEKYYHTNYHHLLKIIESKYTALLSNEEQDYITHFKRLSADAQCLYLRLQNRKGIYFRFSKLEYSEIDNIQERLQELKNKKFVSVVKSSEDDIETLLWLYNRNELIDLLTYCEHSLKGLSKLNKFDLVEYISRQLPHSVLWQVFTEAPIIRQNHVDEALMVQFLYFGTIDMDMTQFVIRDLGNLRFEQIDESSLTTTFNSRKEAEDKLMLSLAYKLFREFRKTETPDEYFLLINNWLQNTHDISPIAIPLYDRLILRSGQFLEKEKLPLEALEIYEFTNKAPSRERRVRILQKLGENETALELCHQMMGYPENAHEKYFAKDFIKKMGGGSRFVKSTTQFQKEAEIITIAKDWQHNVELGVLDWHMERGMQGFFAENFVWRALWGLLFWDIIFDEEHTGIHNPFQRSPDDLFTENFLLLRGQAITERLSLLHQPDRCKSFLKSVFLEKYGMANPIIGWFDELWPMVESVLNKLPLSKLEKVFLAMCTNLRDNSKGFPDLFVWDETDYCFVEVKSPNDTLSSQQLFWLELFSETGINAKLLNVRWE